MRATRRRVVAIAGLVLVVLCVAAGVGVVALGSNGSGQYAASIPSLDNYPGATVLGVGTPAPKSGSTDTHAGQVLVLLDTTDSDQQVFAFYDSRLLNAGWISVPSITPPLAHAATRMYEYYSVPQWIPSWVPFLDKRMVSLTITVDSNDGSSPIVANDSTSPNRVWIVMFSEPSR
ncbi:MAG: hypothetical protein ACJ78Q_17370 [Chloroflexia bacterium]